MSTQDQLVLSGVVLAIVQTLKYAGLPAKWAGLTAIVLGVCVASLWTSDFSHWRSLILDGITVGLVAAGAYSQAQTHITEPDAKT